jgi:hypothetical protein
VSPVNWAGGNAGLFVVGQNVAGAPIFSPDAVASPDPVAKPIKADPEHNSEADEVLKQQA